MIQDLLDFLNRYVLSDRLCMIFFMIVLSLNHISLYYSAIYIKVLPLLSYIWVGIIYIYHTFITRKYGRGHLFKMAQVFLLINMIVTFVRPQNHRVSVLQDFAQLIIFMFASFGAYYNDSGKVNRKGFHRLLSVFVCITFAVSLASIVAIRTGSSLVSIQPGYPDTRARGFYYETNEGGFNAFASILFGLYFFRLNRQQYGRSLNLTDAICILNVPVQLLLIKENGSRTSLLFLMVAFAMLLWKWMKKKIGEGLPKWVPVCAGIVILAVLYILILTPYGFSRNLYFYMKDIPSWTALSSEEKGELLSRISSFRYYIWKTSFEEIVKSPWIGYGLKSANFTYTVFRNFSNSHNTIINTLLFSGLLGLSVLTVYILDWFQQARRNTDDPADSVIEVFILAFMGISLLEMAFLYNGKVITVICWAAMGYLASPKDEYAAECEASITVIERIKNVAAWLMNATGIVSILMHKTYHDNQMIRVINYHRTPKTELKTFEKQLKWYKKIFRNIDYSDFTLFMDGRLTLEKPGIILSFDDGLLNNYEYAAPLLEKYGFTGWFFVSTGLADGVEYMTYDDMKDLVRRGHVIGCHTYSHHRMSENDTEEVLYHEITEAKQQLEEKTDSEIDIFCWCGGEEDTYTSKAQKIIRDHYRWGFMTNNEPVTPLIDHYQLQRTNVEARWPLHTARLQICGFMDRLYQSKRIRVNEKTQ